jgi:DMSO/TMAO reductase YedYZ molybdopterin-dependent catalytic subunit
MASKDVQHSPQEGDESRSKTQQLSGGVGRRQVLRLGAVAAGVAASGAAAPNAFAGHVPPLPVPDRPPPSHDLVTYEETRLAFRCHGMHLELLDRPITPVGSHFQLIHFDIPTLQSEGFKFTIQGRVAKPLTLTLEDLKRRKQVKQPSIMECAGTGRSYAHPRAIYVPWFNEDIGVFEYTGTPLGPILREAGLGPDAVEVVFTGHDAGWDLGVHHNFERALPIDEAMADGVILAWEANGQPLPPAHGFPLRLVVPTWYGMASVKWLKSITVIDHPFHGVEQELVYRQTFSASDNGRPIQKKAVRSSLKPPGEPDLLTRHRFLPQGRHEIRGMAWSGHGAITKVEVSTDGFRSFQPAVLEDPVSPFAEFVIGSRATDDKGHVQPTRPFWNIQGMAQNAVEPVAVRVL